MFGADLTWVGWIFVIDMMCSVIIHLYRAGDHVPLVREPGESAVMAVMTVLYLVGFFTVGFVN